MKIKNFEDLAKTEGRKAALLIADAGLEAIDTASVIKKSVSIRGGTFFVGDEEVLLGRDKTLCVVAVGKCAFDASVALEEILGDRITRGIAIDVKEIPRLTRIKAYRGTHPFPSEENVRATEALIALLGGLHEDDVVLFVVSGGGSTLLSLPETGTVEDEKKIVQGLFKTGATIQELNTVRKHLSRARGGFLAQYAYPARVFSLIFSDVPGDDMEFIASGPTIKDTTRLADAEAVARGYDLGRLCGIADFHFIETPKEDRYFKKVKNILAVSNSIALQAMKQKAEELGFGAEIRTAKLVGEASEVGTMIAEKIVLEPPHHVVLYGGETTVTIRGSGRGGRNQELALAALLSLDETSLVVSVASDGRDDGDFGGAICDIITAQQAKEQGLDPRVFLENNDSSGFFEKVGGALRMDATGSNVADLVIALKI